MLLDVDGVLNVLGPNRKTVRIGRRLYAPGYPLWPREFTKPFLRWAWREFDVVWCTAWRARANLIARWARLPDRPHLSDVGSRYKDWKLGAVIKSFGRLRSQKIVWVEDEFHDQTRMWATYRPNVLLVKTNYWEGVLPRHVEKIKNFIRFH